ncbi:hypothetical protein ACI79J_13070 [Geodermatophilus sp. SYSU D01062]
MTQPAERSDGDYGYDMAHEAAAGAARAPVPPVGAEPADRTGHDDPGGDYGYDEVHSS